MSEEDTGLFEDPKMAVGQEDPPERVEIHMDFGRSTERFTDGLQEVVLEVRTEALRDLEVGDYLRLRVTGTARVTREEERR